ncbi:MAG: hypothetical protein IPK72_21575 [Candidatus Eisenbacteria bacterium]|nr:hypothetical protein [Candidatus Eisenbacteria bacterium]
MGGISGTRVNEDGLTVRQEKAIIALINETTVAGRSRASVTTSACCTDGSRSEPSTSATARQARGRSACPSP